MDFYYAQTDNNGVLCVDQVGDEEHSVWDMERVSKLADSYPAVIYFAVDNVVPEYRVPVERNAPMTRSAHTRGDRDHAWASDCAACGEESMAQQVIALWNRLDGWIPGVAYTELAEVLGVDPALLPPPRMMRKEQADG